MMIRTIFWALQGFLALQLVMAVPPLSQTIAGCQQKCGDVHIPYPFGIEDQKDQNCFQDQKFSLFCNDSLSHPLHFTFAKDSLPIQNISLNGQMKVAILVASDCYSKDGKINQRLDINIGLTEGYRFSHFQNKFVAIGCDTKAYISDFVDKYFQSGCMSYCGDRTSVTAENCSGIGCCQTEIPKDVSSLNMTLRSFRNHTETSDFNLCSYAFLAANDWFTFKESDLQNFPQRLNDSFSSQRTPVVMDWFIGNVSCAKARSDADNYACGSNTHCSDSPNGPGYLCKCNDGYDGNPYLKDGCKDIDECINPKNDCVGNCTNTVGSYTCSCPQGKLGDGRREESGGSGCTVVDSPEQLPVIQVTLGIGVGSLLLLLGIFSIIWCLQKKKLMKMKEKFFYQNGGMLLKQKLSSDVHSIDRTKIFTSEELKKATDNYHDSRILGRGGFGTVYKGILPNGTIVAIKKSKIVDKKQNDQFINEVFILSQVNHRNVVKLLGCCLETEVPSLVYEFINNGTLFHHIVDEECKYSISWNNRLRIAAETAGALAYLHSSASQPIIHGDIKSVNILLDNHYTAKVADFGASRLISFDQDQLSTLVQGTMGYLDPEYLATSLLTEKSDVYSFGVVLVELLTGRQALCFQKSEEERNVVMLFLSSMKENHVFEILEDRVVNEGKSEELQEVANLARRCLRLSGEERPSMKEVAMELEGIRIADTHAWVNQNPEESVYLLGEPVGGSEENSVGYNSMKDQVKLSLHIGR